MTASDARKNWFRVLDEVAAGEVVCIERGGRRVVLRRDEEPTMSDVPDYTAVLSVPEANHADRWGWAYGPDGDLVPVTHDDA